VPENRRSQTRYTVAIDCTLTLDGQPRDRVMSNLSLGGCHVVYDDRVAFGTRVEVTFRIPTHESPIVVGGTTRWSNDDGVGIQFDGLRAAEVWSLNKYFETLRH